MFSCLSGTQKAFFKRAESEKSEIFVEESPAEPSDEVHGEGHHDVLGRVPEVAVVHSCDHQGPHTQRDKAGGETKKFELIEDNPASQSFTWIYFDIFMVKTILDFFILYP